MPAQHPPAPLPDRLPDRYAVLGHPVALCMLARGQSRIGDTLKVWHLGHPVEAEVVKTPFYDPSGERLNGIA